MPKSKKGRKTKRDVKPRNVIPIAEGRFPKVGKKVKVRPPADRPACGNRHVDKDFADYLNFITDKVAIAATKLGMTSKELAIKAGVTENTVKRLMKRDTKSPHTRTVRGVCWATGVSMDMPAQPTRRASRRTA